MIIDFNCAESIYVNGFECEFVKINKEIVWTKQHDDENK